MAIKVSFKGGLGNQLFIWATGLALAKRHQQSLIGYSGSYRRHRLRQLETTTFDSGISRNRPFVAHSIGRGTIRDALDHGRSDCFFETSPMFSPQVLDLGPSACLHGYFQSAEYFGQCQGEISARINCLHSPSQWFESTLRWLNGFGGFVGVHVRRGDFVAKPRHGVLSSDYYAEALERLDAQGYSDAPVVIFSDEPAAVSEIPSLMRRESRWVLVAPQDSRPIESLVLLARADAIVCANSTFSWWSAYLASFSGASVVSPSAWSQARFLTNPNMSLEQWEKVEPRYEQKL